MKKQEYKCDECPLFTEKMPKQVIGYCKRWLHPLTVKNVGCVRYPTKKDS